MKKVWIILFFISLKLYASDIPNILPIDEDGIRCTLGFGVTQHNFTREEYFHKGIDLALSANSKIIAPADGYVEIIGEEKLGRGKYIEINHRNGFKTKYNHLNEILVDENQEVTKYMLIGLMGNTGLSTGAHLHYEILIDSQNIDPEILINLNKENYEHKTNEELKNYLLSFKASKTIKQKEENEIDNLIIYENKKYDFKEILKISESYKYKKRNYKNNVTYDMAINKDFLYIKNEKYNYNSLEIHTNKIKTNRGITINNSLSEVFNTYGKPLFININKTMSDDFVFKNYENNLIIKSIDEIRMDYIFDDLYEDKKNKLRIMFLFKYGEIINISLSSYIDNDVL